MRFEFVTTTRIVFGKGTISETAAEAAVLGKRACVITGSSVSRIQHLVGQLEDRGITTLTISVTGEPTIDAVQHAAGLARHERCDIVIGVGGGSVIDTGKAVAALITNHGSPLDYLEIIGKGRQLSNPSVPYIALPTTAGTGAEVTKNAVLVSPNHGIKVSMRSPFLLPRLAIIDPALTYTLPPDITASTGIDALTQCIEAYVSNKANPLTDALCREGILRAARSLITVCRNGSDSAAREDMALTSLFGGLALANAGLGAVHGFAAVIGGKYSVSHGTLCGLLLPSVLETNITALTARFPDAPARVKFTSLASLLTNDIHATPMDAVQWIKTLCAQLPLHHPPSLHPDTEDRWDIISAAAKASSMKGNPVALTDTEMMDILDKTFAGVICA